MSQAIPVPFDCSNVCVPTGTSSTPGPTGPQGIPGTDGTNGINAETTHGDANGVMPNGNSSGETVTLLTTSDTAFLTPGEPVFVQFWGTLIVDTVDDSSHVTLSNPADSTTGAYASNAAAGTTLPAGAQIVPTGTQGVTGTTDATLFLQVANNLNDVANVVASRSNLGLGTAAVANTGVTTGTLAPNDGNLVANEIVVATAGGIDTRDAATARALLGLTLGTSDTDIAPVDGGGGLVNGDIVVATAAGIITATAAAIRTLLGVGQSDQLLYQHQTANNTDGAAVTAGAWTTVPLTDEVVDVGNHGTLAGNEITLDAGTYSYRFMVLITSGDPAVFLVGRLFNVTDSAVVTDSYGSTGYFDPAGGTAFVSSIGNGRFVLAGAKAIRMECQIPVLITAIYGKGASFGINNRFSWIELWKEA